LGEALAGLRGKAFIMVVGERPDTPDFIELPLDAQGPAIECRFPFPEQFVIAMDAQPTPIVFRQRVAQQAEVKKIRRDWLKLEWCLVALIERAHIGPHPANAMFLEEANEVRSMPAGVAKFDREAKIRRQLRDEIPEGDFLCLWRVRRGQLNQDDTELRNEWLERLQKGSQL